MKSLYTQEEFDNAKSGDKLPCECYRCGNVGFHHKRNILQVIRNIRPGACCFCSKSCAIKYIKNSPPLEVECTNCGIKFTKPQSEIKKSNNHFCTHSCNATYHNKNKKTGTRRSKLESYIEKQLIILYSELEIHFNRKDTIGSELDIYIPSLNIAFELNGIFHYEPIYGTDKLRQIQENDISKSKACHDHKIDLCIIDTSAQSYVKPLTSQKYLDIVTNIINERLLIPLSNKKII